MSILLGHQVKKKERNKVFEGKKKKPHQHLGGTRHAVFGGLQGAVGWEGADNKD